VCEGDVFLRGIVQCQEPIRWWIFWLADGLRVDDAFAFVREFKEGLHAEDPQRVVHAQRGQLVRLMGRSCQHCPLEVVNLFDDRRGNCWVGSVKCVAPFWIEAVVPQA
jgi:hypothetical protein